MPPAVELDHLFLCTLVGAPEAEQLNAFGLIEGTANTHPGQGTTNRRFFFANLMLELLWVHDPEEAQSESVRPTQLWQRWANRNHGACPFGFCLRPSLNSNGSNPQLPFSTWEYRPAYLPANLSCRVATNVDLLHEPMLFYIPFGQRQDTYPADRAQPLDHAIGLREVTRVLFVTPHADSVSPELRALVEANLLQVKLGTQYLVELGFDNERQGKQADFRPALPLMLRW